MSVSSFHAHFKKVTTLSPLQYQKQLRLHEARRLLLSSATNASDAGFRVGYESASQFSREYARHFGLPPLSDIKRSDIKRPQPR
jgi:AraC-like DNA-binding protein